MIECPRCNQPHDGSGLPPSLKGKMKMCVDCYKLMKKISDKEWRDKNPGISAIYARHRRAKNPKAAALEWKQRSERYKIKRKLLKLKGKVS